MKNLRKIIPALCLLLVSAVLLGTSTFAWFSMNNKVTVTGMEVQTKVGNNLFITADSLASTATIKTDASYKSNYVTSTEAATLEPVSTVNGKDFYYTTPDNVLASGDASSDTYTAFTTDEAFASAITVTGAKGYVDYVFQIKAVNTSTTGTADVILSKLALTYGGSADSSKAWRVALFVENLDTVTNSTKVVSATAPTGDLSGVDKTLLFTPASAANFTDGKAVAYASDAAAATAGASDGKALQSVTYVNDTTSAKWSVAADTTAYFKVVVRLWLEGEDTTCNNDTFVQLTDKWALDLEFVLESTASSATTPVKNIAQTTTATKVDLSAATKGTNTKIVDGVTYTELSVTGYYITDSTYSSTSHVYTITNGSVADVTNQCTLPAPVAP